MRDLRHIKDRRYNDPPDNLGTERCRDKIDAILDDPDGYKVTDEYNHGDVRAKLRRYHGTKCVYCESEPIASSTFRIDHYRPKKNIKLLANDLHPGYYWLAYEWTNLMQSCQLCNGVKSNHFPLAVEQSRVYPTTPGALISSQSSAVSFTLSQEERLLLNPELDEVEKSFSFDEDGTINGLDNPGSVSIEKYGLDRGDLILVRKKIRDQELEKIELALKDFEDDSNDNYLLAEKILKRTLHGLFRYWLSVFKKNQAYSLYYFHMIRHFDTFFVQYFISKNNRDLLLKIHVEYLNQQH